MLFIDQSLIAADLSQFFSSVTFFTSLKSLNHALPKSFCLHFILIFFVIDQRIVTVLLAGIILDALASLYLPCVRQISTVLLAFISHPVTRNHCFIA